MASAPGSSRESARDGVGPGGRYGRTGAQGGPTLTSRALAILLGLLVVAVLAAAALWGYRYLTSPEISGKASGYQVLDDHTVELRLDVTRSEPSKPVVCIVRAKESSGAEIARRELYVQSSGEETVRLTTRLTTPAPAVEADVYGCGEEVPDYLDRSPAPGAGG